MDDPFLSPNTAPANECLCPAAVYGNDHADTCPVTVRKLRRELERAISAGTLIVKGFDAGVFVRDVSHDGEPGWALRAAPYLAALAEFAPQEPEWQRGDD